MLSSTILKKYFLLGLIVSLMVTSTFGRSFKREVSEEAEALENDTEQSLTREKRQLGMMGLGGIGGFGAPGLMGGGLMGGGGGILDLLVLSSVLGGGNGFGGGNMRRDDHGRGNRRG
jgi:hypothetical protein